MQTLDLSTSLSPVINLSEKTIEQSFLDACGYPLTKILIQDLSEKKEPVSVPVRIIEGMEKIADRGTVNKKQAMLISELFELMLSSPILRA